jgi:hypothetical protein
MDEILFIGQKVRNTITLGESHFREFKTALEGRPENKASRENIRSIGFVCKCGWWRDSYRR